MSYTNAELVKRQVSAPPATGGKETTLTLTLSGSAWTRLITGTIADNTVTVTARTQAEPSLEVVTFTTDTATLGAAPIDSGGIVVANNSSLGAIYTEGIDYVIDFISGSLQRLPTGSISSGASVAVWYLPLTLFSANSDYEVDNENGLIRRTPGSAIADGQRVTVTFTATSHGVTPEVYDDAVNEADRIVSAAVDPNTDFGADPNLQTAATFIAAGIVCRISASAALASGASGRDAKLWLDLAASFQSDGRALLDNFKPPRKNLTGPKQA